MAKRLSAKILDWLWTTFVGFIVICLIPITFVYSKPERSQDFEHHSNIGISYLSQRKYDVAEVEFKRALKINPTHLPTIINLGLSYHHQLKYDDAVETFKMALEIDPNEPYAHYNLGLIYNLKRNFDDAARELEKVVAVDPNDPAARYNLGTVYLKQGKFQKAEDQFRRVIKLYPDSYSAYYGLGKALIDAGKKEEAAKVLAKFQELKKSGIVSAEREKYLREGKYLEPMVSVGEFSLPKERTAKDISEVRFIDIVEGAGLKFRHGEGVIKEKVTQSEFGSSAKSFPPAVIEASEYSIPFAKRNIVSKIGSGAAFADYDNDADLDLYIVNCSDSKGKSANVLYRNNGDGTFTDLTDISGVGDTGMGMGCVFGDYDNDGDLDLYVTNYGANVLYRNEGDGTFTDVTQIANVGNRGFSTSAAFGDYDNDNDLDLYVANYINLEAIPSRKSFRFPKDFTGQPNVLYRNNGNGTFTDVTVKAKVDSKGKSIGVVFTDFDNDRDVDLYIINDSEPNILYSNNGDGTFADITKSANIGEPIGAGAAVGDYNNDGKMDIFITGYNTEANVLYRNRGNSFVKVAAPLGVGGFGSGFLDYDNDGDLDIFLTGQNNLLFRNDGNDNFADVSEVSISASVSAEDKLLSSTGRGVALGDYDNDGDTDIFIVNNGGFPTLLRNEGGNSSNWLKVHLVGQKSNKNGIGAKVEMKSGDLWQKREIASGGSFMSQNSLTAEFGLRDKSRVDLIGITWPSGVRQFVASVPVNLRATITEAPGTTTSCPHLYAWDGSKYNFITDFLGGGALGYLIAPNVYHYPDSDEYIKIDGSKLKEMDGFYSLKIVNALQEVVYLDKTRLLVIDHPEDVDVYPNERFMASPPFPEFYIHTAKNARPPISAMDDKGNDILPLITKRDRTYPDFELLPYKGYAKLHSIILDCSRVGIAHPTSRLESKISLILYGWVEYPESYSNLAASQGDVELIPPYVEVLDSDGKWRTVIGNAGFPAGLPKTMIMDLTGKFLTQNYKVKITTNMQIYWDEILVNTFSDSVPMTVTTLESFNADLHWKGYPGSYTPDGKMPYLYDYYGSDEVFWESHAGNYTKYGNVTELLTEVDDKFVIMRHGDEITVNFDAKRLPELPLGWSRDFFFYADGFSKDMDMNTACSSTVEPLPFHGMSNYPYSENESYPFDEEHKKYIKEYNTRLSSYELRITNYELKEVVR